MKKERALAILFILSIIFAINLVIAANDTEIDKSYACLKKQLGSNCQDTQNTVQNAFSLIAMAYDSSVQSDCESLLNSKKKTDCWGDTASSSSCTIKATAIAALALKHINENIDDSINWLKSKKKTATDLTWYLEIDANNLTECTINGIKATIGENKKISGSDPAGLKKAYNNYWYEITDIKKNYTIACDSNFITTLLFKKPTSAVYFVSSLTHSGAGGDSVTESVNGLCFGTTDKCDYESTVWAALALNKVGEDISSYMPYIAAMADDPANKKYFPLAFLYMLDNSVNDYLQGLLNLQKQNKYWKEGDNLLYDTAIGLLALQGSDIEQAINARAYLLTLRETSGDIAGCWRSDTALILYAGWIKSPTTGNGGPITAQDCTAYNNFCVSRGECPVNSTLNNFNCPSLSDICCSVKPAEQTCEEKGGIKCGDNEECSQSLIPAQDTQSCCLNACQQITTPTNECEDNRGLCRTECKKGEEEKSLYQDSCEFNEVCCTQKTVKPVNWWLIILLIILIILVILAIIFRNQLKIWWFKVKSQFKSKKGPEPTTRPSPSPPAYPGRPSIMPRQIIPRPSSPPQRPMTRPPIQSKPEQGKRGEKDKEFEDTMKKLRDMSK